MRIYIFDPVNWIFDLSNHMSYFCCTADNCNLKCQSLELSINIKCILQLTYEDSDIADTSLKCLSLLVQLYGGESPDAMSAENMVS